MNLNKFLNLDYLKENPLCGIGTYKDTLNLATGECTRNIEKLVFTGQESWALHSSYANLFRLNTVVDYLFIQENIIICNAYASISNRGAADVGDKQICCYFSTGSSTRTLYIKDLSYNNADDFKTYLSQQYANGTPVTVWYVLETPTTETIAVPTGLSGIVEGYLTQSGTPTPSNPIYPTANNAEGWYPFNYYIMDIATDTLPQLPSTIYPTNTYLNVELEGNSVQNGTPSPSSPVDVNGVGDESDVTGFIVTTTINDITTTEVIARGDAYSKTAPTISGKTFNYWTDGTQIVSYNSSLGCIITENIHYTAIYSDSTVTKEDVMLLSMEKTTYNNMDAVACVLNTHILSGTNVTEIGIKFATNKQLGYDSSYGSDYATVNLMELQGWDVYSLLQTLGSERPSDFTNINTRYSFSVGVSTAHQAYLYFIGYYKYNDNGTIKTVYSNYAVGGCYDTALTPGAPTTHYNIPITCSNITYNRYLSETESIRYIKKLVFDGSEDWARNESGGQRYYFRLPDTVTDGIVGQVMCSHYVSPEDAISANNTVEGMRIQDTTNYGRALIVRTPNYTTDTLSDFKAYLQQQYAAGTPVTVWYVLATPETLTINEPLMKIGNYTDKINTTIPTKGTTEITVNTTIQPSNISVDGFQNMEIGLKGNTVQNSTPTPNSPVDVVGVGERTTNLFDISTNIVAYYITQTTGIYSATSSTSRSALIPCEPSTTYTVHVPTNRTLRIVEFDHYPQVSDVGSNYTSQETGSYIDKDVTITTTATAKYLCVFCYNSAQEATQYTESEYFAQVMIIEGSTAPSSYIPYGYKLPISSANTTTPIYLGEVETTRRIGKYECTGNETWQIYSNSDGTYGVWQFFANDLINGVAKTSAYSNIVEYGVTADSRSSHPYGVYLVTSGTGIAFQMVGAKDTFPNLTAWKSYLAEQYANGTPVTIWYILASETTGIVNEPLQKIGSYADSINNISITTTDRINTIDIPTTVQPSEVTVNYTGWHPVQNIHEYYSNYTIADMQTFTIAQLQTYTISELQEGEWL